MRVFMADCYAVVQIIRHVGISGVQIFKKMIDVKGEYYLKVFFKGVDRGLSLSIPFECTS